MRALAAGSGGAGLGRPNRRRFLAGTAASLAVPALARAAGPPEDPTAGRALLFEDTFTHLDTAIWNAGPKATTFDSGYYGRSAFALIDGEEGVNPYAIVEDALAADGRALQISAQYVGRPMRIHGYHGNHLPEYWWVSGNLQTAKRNGVILKGWREGYFEASMRVPSHPLAWSAFWLMNGRSILYPKTSIEIDVVEHKGWEPRLYGTYLHEWGKPGEHHEGMGVTAPADLTRGYHRYGMLVTRTSCSPYLDGRPVRRPGTNDPVVWPIGRSSELDRQDDVFWPLLTLALRNDVPFPDPLPEAEMSAHLRIDSVRVFA